MVPRYAATDVENAHLVTFLHDLYICVLWLKPTPPLPAQLGFKSNCDLIGRSSSLNMTLTFEIICQSSKGGVRISVKLGEREKTRCLFRGGQFIIRQCTA